MFQKCYMVCESLQKLQRKYKWSSKQQIFYFTDYQFSNAQAEISAIQGKNSIAKGFLVCLVLCFFNRWQNPSVKNLLKWFFFFFAFGNLCKNSFSMIQPFPIFHKVVSIIYKINIPLLCKYTNYVFIRSVKDNKTLKNYVCEKILKALQTPREAVQKPLG